MKFLCFFAATSSFFLTGLIHWSALRAADDDSSAPVIASSILNDCNFISNTKKSTMMRINLSILAVLLLLLLLLFGVAWAEQASMSFVKQEQEVHEEVDMLFTSEKGSNRDLLRRNHLWHDKKYTVGTRKKRYGWQQVLSREQQQ
jgi:hypothetical protein